MKQQTKDMLFSEIIKRCETASFVKCKPQKIKKSTKALSVEYLLGGKKFELLIITRQHAQSLLKVPFQVVKPVFKYQAFYSERNQSIEALLGTEFDFHQAQLVERVSEITSRRDHQGRIKFESNDKYYKGAMLTIGYSSEEFRILNNLWWQAEMLSGLEAKCFKYSQQYFTIRIENIELSGLPYSSVVDFLERLSGSVCYQLENTTGIPTCLGIRNRKIWGTHHFNLNREKCNLVFPEVQYDLIPLSLYLEGSKMPNLPFWQYVHYYQAIEYYLPPGDQEKKRFVQLVEDIVDESELRSFIVKAKDRQKFFTEKSQYSKICKYGISLSPGKKVARQAAQRIYDIRCDIAHKKKKKIDSKEQFHPSSEEAYWHFHFDIELVNFVARQFLKKKAKGLKL